jgi:hypothetical protein
LILSRKSLDFRMDWQGMDPMNKGQKILTGITLVLFALLAFNLVDGMDNGIVIALVVLAVVYTGVMFMLKSPAPKP